MPLRILIVDDEPDLEQLIRQRFRKKIQAEEFEFYSALNGREALQVLKNKKVDIVLSDINMPTMDGLALLEEIRSLNNPLLKAIIVSAYGDMKNIRLAMNRGAFDFVTKPISFGDLETTLQKAREELNFIRDTLKHQEAFQALQQELKIARHIQLSILPSASGESPRELGYEIDARMEAAREVGGDFYDYFKVDPNHLGFLIGDVAGKGIPAAIFMAVCKTTLKATALNGASPAECLTTVNNVLVRESICDIFVTAFYGILDLQSGELEYCNAGHNAPFLINGDRQVSQLKVGNGIPLGFLENFRYFGQNIQLLDQDTVFLYTDGITEAMGPDEIEFSEKRLHQTLQSHRKRSLSGLNQTVIQAVHRHNPILPRGDDMTVLSLRFSNRGAPRTLVEEQVE